MSDLQELVKTTYGQGNPVPDFYVSVDDARKLLEENKRLRAIVDRLPKTADGVPLVPGLDYFWLPYEANGAWKVQKLDCLFRTEFMAGVRRDEICKGYSTREAAEKARAT